MQGKQTTPLTAWEEAENLPAFVKGGVRLAGFILFKPVDFFGSLVPSRGLSDKKRLGRAILFAILLGYLKLLMEAANILWLRQVSPQIFSTFFQVQFSYLSSAVLNSPFFLLRPVLTFGVTFGLLLVSLKLILGFQRPGVPVFLILCYRSAADIFTCLPFFGGVLAGVWSLALLMIGIRQVYSLDLGRSLLTAFVMPLVIFLFFALSLGPSLNKVLLKVYPEVRSQITKFNDLSGYMYTLAIANAARTYKQELGFYPVNIELLKKYLTRMIADDVEDPDNASGYVYAYTVVDDDHFMVRARPSQMGTSGRFLFYGDETGKVRLNGPEGLVVSDADMMGDLIEEAAAKGERG